MLKLPVTGVVAHVSQRGTEVRLAGDPKRYRGVKLHPELVKHWPGSKTFPLFYLHDVQVGDTVRLEWGGFADLNIRAVRILRHRSSI